ncbi:MAG: magnesium chelatase subunit H [Burkholderiaceae bacterium]
MTPKRTLAANPVSIRVVIVTMDSHLASATSRAALTLGRQLPGLQLRVHAASEWSSDPATLECCLQDIAQGDIIIVSMLFMEDHFRPVLSALAARRLDCDAMICMMSASEVTKLTRMGRFDMEAPASGPMALLKRLRGNKPKTGSAGAQQMKMLRRLPQILRYIPGTAQDVRAYFLALQYWLGGSEENVSNLVCLLVDRYATGARAQLRGVLKVAPPVEYPEVGVYHPRLANRLSEVITELPVVVPANKATGRVGLLLLRSYLLAGNTGHYDGVIAALEARGMQVVPAFATGLDARPAIERFFLHDGKASVDAIVSLTGFSLVGGPAYNDARAAEEILARLDVPYFAAHPVEFQMLDEWESSERGLLPVESTIMVAIPELDGATAPMVFGGRAKNSGHARDMQVHSERADALAARVSKQIALRKSDRAKRKIAVVLFNFPPNAGNTGTAAHLSVFESLYQTMIAMKAHGYSVEIPASVDELRNAVICGNAQTYGALANVCARIPTDDHVRREKHLAPIEAQWGPAPGRLQSDGASIHILGAKFGNILVGIQPGMGFEGDPMRLLFDKSFAPTHAFSAFYRYVREDFGAHAVLHFGTHGALEFMPGKQTGMSGNCWPERLLGDLPNLYLYASNNPSEGTIAKRRAAATLISYLTPPVCEAGLYRGLLDLKASIQRWREQEQAVDNERRELAALIHAQAAELELAAQQPSWLESEFDLQIEKLGFKVLELEYTLIPHGLHVVGKPLSIVQRVDMLMAIAASAHATELPRQAVQLLVEGHSAADCLYRAGLPNDTDLAAVLEKLAETDALLTQDHEIEGILRALDGRFLRPSPGGDLLRTPEVLPTGRNLHGFDPFRLPSAFAVQEGAKQVDRLLERHISEGNSFPESIALVLWGTDNLKTEGAPIAQALALLGTKPRFDSYGRLAGALLVPLEELGRPRIDVIMTLSGIFRDLLPLQIKLLAEAAFLAATADEPLESNFVRKHALAYQAKHGCDLETAALRVFGNAEGAYGANVNHLVDSSRWDDEDELAETYSRRKGFAYGRGGRPIQHGALLQSVLADVDLAYQNLDSVELGVTTVDTYFDTLGGIARAVRRAKTASGASQLATPVYIGDQTRGDGTVRTLSEQVALETRTRMLNPKWYEGMLEHGYEGVRQIEVHVTNTMGWSATTGQVAPWVYRQLTRTFMLDPQMRDRLARLNPTASAKVASRLLEASERRYWQPSGEELEALRRAGEELEDRLEGVFEGVAA